MEVLFLHYELHIFQNLCYNLLFIHLLTIFYLSLKAEKISTFTRKVKFVQFYRIIKEKKAAYDSIQMHTSTDIVFCENNFGVRTTSI